MATANSTPSFASEFEHGLRLNLSTLGDQLDKILAVTLASQALYTESGRTSTEFHLLQLIETLASDASAFYRASDILDSLEKRREACHE